MRVESRTHKERSREMRRHMSMTTFLDGDSVRGGQVS